MEDSSRSKADEQGAAIYDNKHTILKKISRMMQVFFVQLILMLEKIHFTFTRKTGQIINTHACTQPWNPVRR